MSRLYVDVRGGTHACLANTPSDPFHLLNPLDFSVVDVFLFVFGVSFVLFSYSLYVL